MPRFLIDEDMPRSTSVALQEAGYDATDVRDVGLRGEPDHEIFEHAQELSAAIVTRDVRFANAVEIGEFSHHGMFIVRLPNVITTDSLNRELLNAIENLDVEKFENTIVVVEVGRVRLRRRQQLGHE